MNIVQRLRPQKIVFVLLFAFVLLLALTATTQAAPEQASPPESGGVYHTIRWGETLSGIAVHYGTTVQAIMAANPQIWNPNIIYAGTVLYIPYGYTPPQPPPLQPPSTYCRYYHTVTYGDTLNKISAWYGVNIWTIAQANHIYNLNLIYRGQVLCIP